MYTEKNFLKSNEHRQIIHNLIPGGSHTYSKGDDQFPLLSPAAIVRGKGAHVWDLDDNKFLDCTMGLTSVCLGHAYEPVLKKVREELENGVNFSRPSVIEREMAEQFLDLIPCHDMIKFSKNGSTITTAAVKMARAYTGRDLVAFPSNHPFYSYDDWFIGKTDCDWGVPEIIKSLSVTYKAGDLESLKNLFDQYPGQIAGVISEPEKFDGVPEGYLKEAYAIIKKNGALTIQDEMITGFKLDFPGAITKYNVEPDLATWGKGIANGFSFSALTGKKEIMEIGGIKKEGQRKFFLISTTHGGETHAIAAGLATINEFKTKNVIAHNHAIGAEFIKLIKNEIKNENLHDFIKIFECPWHPVMQFKNRDGKDCLGMKTLFCQEMIKRGVLFQGLFIPCFSHTSENMKEFALAASEAMKIYSLALEAGFEKFLVGPATKPVFRKFV